MIARSIDQPEIDLPYISPESTDRVVDEITVIAVGCDRDCRRRKELRHQMVSMQLMAETQSYLQTSNLETAASWATAGPIIGALGLGAAAGSQVAAALGSIVVQRIGPHAKDIAIAVKSNTKSEWLGLVMTAVSEMNSIAATGATLMTRQQAQTTAQQMLIWLGKQRHRSYLELAK